MKTRSLLQRYYEDKQKEEIDPAELRNRFGISRDYILTVGNLQPRKNMVRLIRAYRSLREGGKITHQPVIVGKKAWMHGCLAVMCRVKI